MWDAEYTALQGASKHLPSLYTPSRKATKACNQGLGTERYLSRNTDAESGVEFEDQIRRRRCLLIANSPCNVDKVVTSTLSAERRYCYYEHTTSEQRIFKSYVRLGSALFWRGAVMDLLSTVSEPSDSSSFVQLLDGARSAGWLHTGRG